MLARMQTANQEFNELIASNSPLNHPKTLFDGLVLVFSGG